MSLPISNDVKTFERICNELEPIINDFTPKEQTLVFNTIGTCDLIDLAILTRNKWDENQRLHVFLNTATIFSGDKFIEELFRLNNSFAKRLIKALEFILFDTPQKYRLTHFI